MSWGRVAGWGMVSGHLAFSDDGRAIQTGVCSYDPGSPETGILIGDAVLEEPQFRLYAAGVVPGRSTSRSR